MAPIGVISPHLDDAVLSCGRLLWAHPGSVVVTVFDGGPAAINPITWWDAESGFGAGDDVIAARHAEDAAALAVLGASGVYLGFWDAQYRDGAYGYAGGHGAALEAQVADALDAVVTDAGTATTMWLMPLGLVHPDHQAAHGAARAVARRQPALGWAVYEELPYYDEFPDSVLPARAGLEAEGFALALPDDDVAGAGAGAAGSADGAGAKAGAIGCYPTQCRALGAEKVGAATRCAERYRTLIIPAS
jgi:LmbE family N-acetylglucosaminyl deacetylase